MSQCFQFDPIWDLFALFGLCWDFLGVGSGSKAFFGSTNVDYQLWFWKYTNIFFALLGTTYEDCQLSFQKYPIFSFIIWPPLDPFFCLFGYFWVWGQAQNYFGYLRMYSTNFGFGNIVSSFVSIQPQLGPFLHILDPSGLFVGLGLCSYTDN